jgi:ABC-type antimicrobial peptide transport system permease subunit
MSAIVAQQTREMGIRTALGATQTRIASLVLSDAGRHVAVGLAIGLAAAWAVSGIFSSLVFGVTPTEPILYAVVATVLASVAVAAAWIPARRAARVDPIVALRE